MGWAFWLWARLLLTTDRFLGTRLLEWELARRQRRIERLTADMRAVNQDLDTLAEKLAFYRLALCLVELKARSEYDDPGDWLRFSPQGEGEDPVLDDAIECLVKPRLASIEARRVGPGCYIYHLQPDWVAIIARVRGEAVAPELMAWLEAHL